MATLPARGLAARETLPAMLTIASGRRHTAETILRAWFEDKSPRTIRSYQHDLEAFALYLSRALAVSPPFTVSQALGALFRQPVASAHDMVLGFRHHLLGARLATQTVNRHVAALRSLSKLARMLGMMTWSLEVSGVRNERRRQVMGPTVADVRRMLGATSGNTEAETRDFAIVTVLYCLGLRVSELCGLNLQDTDLEHGSTWILGKGQRERELVPLPATAIDAIRRYLVFRGATAGPLFQTRGLMGRSKDGRLETRSVLRIVRALGQKVGLHVWCHALRHTSITQAAELGQRAGLGLDKIRAHSRHRSIVADDLHRRSRPHAQSTDARGSGREHSDAAVSVQRH
jgi:integrase/recombinase XerC